MSTLDDVNFDTDCSINTDDATDAYLEPCDALGFFAQSNEPEPPRDNFGDVLYEDETGNTLEDGDAILERMYEDGFANGLYLLRRLIDGEIFPYALQVRTYEQTLIVPYCPFCGNAINDHLTSDEPTE